MMKLTGKVVKVESAEGYKDGKSRVYISVDNGEEGYQMYRQFRIPNDDRLTIDDQVEMEVRLVREIARAAS